MNAYEDSPLPAVSEARIGESVVNSVEGRDLHRSLKVGRDYTTWMKARIGEYGFARGVDYEVFTGSGENPAGGRPPKEYVISLDMAKELAMVENNEEGRRVRRHFIECEKRLREASHAGAPLVPTTAEAFASAFMMLAQQERRQADQQRALTHIEARVERVETAQSILSARPANAESITHLRSRIGKMFGLSASVIDEVMRQSPYAPKPAGMVKNDHVDADGAPYAIYWRKDVTATFTRFVSECVPVTATMFTHPFIQGRFRVAGKAVAA